MNEQPQLSSSLSSFIPKLCSMCTKLNNCLPQSQQIEITVSLDAIMKGMQQLVDKIVSEINNFERILQMQEQNLRKHIKNQIELKLYYEHLEDIIMGLRRQKQQTNETINNLKTQLTVLKQKQRYYMTISNANTRNNDDGFQSKIDTIAKIKNRLSLNGTQQFYSNYFARKFQKDTDTKQLRDKRQSLANALKQLYESPVQHKQDILRPKQKPKSKSRQKKQSKDKSHNSSKNFSHLTKNRSTKSMLNNTDAVPRKSFKASDRSQRGSVAKQKSEGKSKEIKQKKMQKIQRGEKVEKSGKSSVSNISSRRNSKA